MRRLLSRIAAALLAVALTAPAAMADDGSAQALKSKHPAGVKTVSIESASRGVPVGKLALPQRKAWHKGAAQMANFTARPARIAPQAATPAAPAFAPAAQRLHCAIVYSDAWTVDEAIGMYALPTSGPASLAPIALGEDFDITMGAMTDTEYVAIAYQSLFGYLVITPRVFDAKTWELKGEYECTNTSCVGSDMVYDPTTGNIYGCFYNEDGSELCFSTLDTYEWKTTPIATIPTPWRAVAVDGNGQIFALDRDGLLLKVDKATGALTTVAATGIASEYATSGAIDPATGVMYVVRVPGSGASTLYAIDTATGQSAAVYDMPYDEQPAGMYIPGPDAVDDAPAAATGLAVSFDGPALSGKATFTAPSLTYGGSPLSGQLAYAVKANGNVAAQGQCAPGQAVEAAISVPFSGMYKFVVTTSNSAGLSPQASVSAFVGYDTPSPVQNVQASWADGVMTVTWDPVSTGANAGVIGEVSYSVSLDGQSKAEGLAQCRYTEAVPMPSSLTAYTYAVSAKAQGLSSAPAYSNTVVLGDIVPPFEEHFDRESDAASWQVIDANLDGIGWQWADGEMVISYNPNMDMDDWLVTPPVKLEANRIYEVGALARNQGYEERVEIRAGAGSAPADMAATVVAPVMMTAHDGETAELKGSFVPEADGIYFFGIHGISDFDQFKLYVDDFYIAAGISAWAPAAPDIMLTPDYKGTTKVKVACAAPTLDIGGRPVGAMTKLEVLCDGKLAHSVDNPVAGQIYDFEATLSEGRHTFAATAYTAGEKGETSTASCYAGINAPAAPAWANIVETKPGWVKISWSPVDTDVDGLPLNPDFVTYVIVGTDGIVADMVAGCEYELQAVPEGEQEFVTYAVYADTDAGMSQQGASTRLLACGTPFTMPYVETFAEGSMSYPMAYEDVVGESGLGIATDEYFEGIASRNGDNGFVYVYTPDINNVIDIFTGKISLRGSAPQISFYYYSLGPQDDNLIKVSVVCDGKTAKIGQVACMDDQRRWIKASLSLQPYIGKDVQIKFSVVGSSYSYTMFDDIRIENPLPYNLCADGLALPDKAAVGKDIEVRYRVANIGTQPASGYSVSLYCDGDLVETVEGLPEIKPEEAYEGVITHAFDALGAGLHRIYAYVDYAADGDVTDNQSRIATVVVAASKLPSVTLKGEHDDATGAVTLSWQEPVLDDVAVDELDDFESDDYEPFSIQSFGPWTLKCLNESATYGINNFDFPNMYEAFGWILFDVEGAGFDQTWCGYDESNRYLAAFAHEQGPNDAWLISPLLSGEAQTISFMARSFSTHYGQETIKAYYSLSGTKIEDFAELPIIGYDGGLPADWLSYSVALPAGAKRFAIVSTSNDVWICQLDNISYRACESFSDLIVKGYNVYRNGLRLNAEPVQATTYVDAAPDASKANSYRVAVVYDQGESKASNEVVFRSLGIDDAAVSAAISVRGRVIVIDTDAEYRVCAPDGRLVAAGTGSAAVAVAPGLYIASAGTAVAKLVVK